MNWILMILLKKKNEIKYVLTYVQFGEISSYM